MEISFENREISICREYLHLSRRTQESVESVVPDTDADIDKIAAVQSTAFLKSKDLTGHGVLISGEISASVLYIPEGRSGLSGLRLRKAFSLEFDAEELESETLAQVSLSVQGTDVRVINPRKLSLVFDIEGRVSCYREERLCVETWLPVDCPGLHALTEEHSLILPKAVNEKSVAVNEQFRFSGDKPLPAALLSEKAELLISDCQLIGSKVIVKGNAELTVTALSDGGGGPCLYEFSSPFSQIVEVGTESMDFCTVRPEITGAYYDLADTISGEKVLDMELHAVLQLVCSERQSIRCIGDVYSNLMPAQLQLQTQSYELLSSVQKKRLSVDEEIELTEACGEVLTALAAPVRVSAEAGRLSAAVSLDLLYRGADGRLNAVRRTFSLAQETEGKALRILNARCVQVSVKPEGERADCALTLEIGCQESGTETLQNVSGVTLDEERAYVQESLPTLTLVRAEGESLWSLARQYHSSLEKIRELNEDAEHTTRMLLIPKCI